MDVVRIHVASARCEPRRQYGHRATCLRVPCAVPGFWGRGDGCCWGATCADGCQNACCGALFPCCLYGVAYERLHTNHEMCAHCPWCFPSTAIGCGACCMVATTDVGIGFIGEYVALHDNRGPATAAEQCSMCCVACCPLLCWQPCQIASELRESPPVGYVAHL